ncbi:MAG: ATP/GTP-binding protein [Anaerolineae bacterium]|nr:ATP/GTP-binding protein [Anaerolineae bacterium]
MKVYKVVVTGPFSAGKTAFVQTASDIEIVTTERQISDPALISENKGKTTVALDYGHKRLGDTMLHFYGTPGQERFEFMWEILAKEMDAFLLLVDSADKASLLDAKQILRLFRKYANVPYLIVANKQDVQRVLSPDEIARLLSLPKDVGVLPCIAQDKKSVSSVLNQLADLLG